MKLAITGLVLGAIIGFGAARAIVPPAPTCTAAEPPDLSAITAALARIDARIGGLERAPAAATAPAIAAPLVAPAPHDSEATARQIASRPPSEWQTLIRESVKDDPDLLAAMIAMANRKEIDHSALAAALHGIPADQE